MSGRGRRIVTINSSQPKNRTLQKKENNRENVYEDNVVFITNSPKPRGRPRRSAILSRVNQARCPTGVVPKNTTTNSRALSRISPVPTLPVLQLTSIIPRFSLLAPIFRNPQPIKCLVSGVNEGQRVVCVPRPVNRVARSPLENKNKDNWPEDLKGLLEEFDELPEIRTTSMIKWLLTLGDRYRPKAVQNIQDMWNSMPEVWEDKVNMALEIIGIDPVQQSAKATQESVNASQLTVNTSMRGVIPSVNTAEVSPMSLLLRCATVNMHPECCGAASTFTNDSKLQSAGLLQVCKAKVVVEAQPSLIQDLNQLSALAGTGSYSN
ncbi:uncharacterized protein LOC128986582 [Macrosteles quadrilineatus]|uniref:uncharacterized protein LOC128986582 n=1 Tax=Macrosteles quadrilineatus TaxID=74068 RepID=UPI0023E19E90|nr:uncharacterized protein LOC128986582 [Macrosteles quadrilineatus]